MSELHTNRGQTLRAVSDQMEPYHARHTRNVEGRLQIGSKEISKYITHTTTHSVGTRAKKFGNSGDMSRRIRSNSIRSKETKKITRQILLNTVNIYLLYVYMFIRLQQHHSDYHSGKDEKRNPEEHYCSCRI